MKAGLLILGVLMLTTVFVYAERGGGYDLTWHVVAGGGSVSSGGGYVLTTNSGQSDAGLLNGGGYTLNGGFWRSNAISKSYRIYLPLSIHWIIQVNPSSDRSQVP